MIVTVPFLFFCAFLHLVTLSKAAIPQCDAGFFLNQTTNVCTRCPVGTYNPSRNKDPSCVSCRAGYAAFAEGKFPARACVSCPAGTFATSGAKSCTKCPEGTDSLRRASRCLQCGPGQEINPLSTVDACKDCDEGFYSDGTANRACKACPLGTVSKQGASQCTKCPKGHIAVKDRFSTATPPVPKCVECAAGTFADVEGAPSCKLCRPGYFSQSGATECTPCPAGQFAPYYRSEACQTCPDGTTSLGLGAAACKEDRRGCTFDTFEDKTGECRACLPGERLDEKKKRCVPCKKNQVSNGGVSAHCMTCPAGRVPSRNVRSIDGFKCVCKPGTFSAFDGVTCLPCSEGLVGVSIIESDGTRILTGGPGDIGFYVVFDGEPSCELCPLNSGLTTRKAGSTKCQMCPKKLYPEYNIPAQATCTKCPKRFASIGSECALSKGGFCFTGPCISKKTGCDQDEVFENGECKLSCRPGSFKATRYTCGRCRPGFFLDEAKNKCENCPGKSTTDGGAQTTCTPCPKGRVQRAGVCICKVGSFDVNGNCEKCPPGTDRNAVAGDDFACRKCFRRRAAPQAGTVECEQCPQGSIASADSTMCVACPAGSQPGKNVRGEDANKCVPTDPYEKDAGFLSGLPGFSES